MAWKKSVHNRYRCLCFLPSYVCHSSVRCLILCPLDVSEVQPIPIASFFRHGFRWRRSTKSSVWAWRHWEIPSASPWLGLPPFHPTTTSVCSASECDVRGGGRLLMTLRSYLPCLFSYLYVFLGQVKFSEFVTVSGKLRRKLLKILHCVKCLEITIQICAMQIPVGWLNYYKVTGENLTWCSFSQLKVFDICVQFWSVKSFWYLCIILECFIIPSPILTCKWIETALFSSDPNALRPECSVFQRHFLKWLPCCCLPSRGSSFALGLCVCVCERERECVCVCERERECVCVHVCVWLWEREGERVCVCERECVCVFMRVCDWERESMCVCVFCDFVGRSCITSVYM